MHIDVIGELNDFDALRRDWDTVYEADPEAHFFLSWQWLSDWLTIHRTVWFVLAAKRNETDAEYVAFLPLRMHTGFDKKHGFSNELVFAGAGFSDYTGILARPELEAEAVSAFAEYVKRKLNWARFTMVNLTMSDRRRRLFLRAYDKIRFMHTTIEYKNLSDSTNHSICPSVNLPDSWDEYLKTLSPNNRQKIRRLLRKIDALEGCRITLSDADSFDQNLATLLDFWKIKWTPSKGAERADEIALRNYRMLTRCAENGTLFVPVFWHGDRPVAALATLIDTCKKSLLFFITGRDETYREMPAGYLLHAYSIRRAIAHGFTTYDFLKGDEPYKYRFAPQQERRQRPVSVITKTNRNLGGKLDPRGLPAMLEMTLEFENHGETADAERGYRQILEIEPDHALALYRFGRFMAENGAHAEAKELLSRSVEVEPEGDNAWFWLARSLQSLGEDEAALEACRKVVKLQPQNKEAKELILQLSLTAEPTGQSATATVWPVKAPEGAAAPRQSPVKAAFRPSLKVDTPEIAEALRYLANQYPS
jgi:CelD/BcsL family acetyltransferase involved in cellulose biosynthesis